MRSFLSVIAITLVWQINAQVVYYNANQFPLLGKTSDETETRHERMRPSSFLTLSPTSVQHNWQRRHALFAISFVRLTPLPPILFMENISYPYAMYDQNTHQNVTEKNKLLREVFEKIKGEGDPYVFYLSTDGLIGEDGEATVQGVHLTDTGFDRLARKIFEAINLLSLCNKL